MTIAAIDDVPLLGSKIIRWALKEGVRPVIETFHVSPAAERRLREKAGGPVEMRIESDDVKLRFRGLYILDFPPGPTPHIKAVRIADRRIWWSRKNVLRRLNIRRRVGYRRIANPQVPEQLQPATERIQYKPWSLRNPAQGFAGRWRARQALEDIFKEVFERERETFGVQPRVEFRDFVEAQAISIENLEINADGASALLRILSYLPGIQVFLDQDGDVVVYSRASGRDLDAVEKAGAELVDTGHLEIVEQKNTRPREVRVHFTREVEVRLDYRSAGVGPDLEGSPLDVLGGTPEAEKVVPRMRGGLGCVMSNVLPLPDFQLTINGVPHTQGEWVEINPSLMTAWGAPPRGNVITDLKIRREFNPFVNSIFNRLERLGALDPHAEWSARVAALKAHYRQTFRIHEHLLDKLLAIRAYRVGTINQATGERGPAMTYGDWAVVPTVKYFFFSNRAQTAFFVNESSFPDGSFLITPETLLMPGIVSVLDEDQGIIRVDLVTDPWHRQEALVPGRFENGPFGDPTRQDVNKAWDAKSIGRGPVQLDDDFRLSIILTVMPGAPNDEGQFHVVTVRPETIQDLLPRAARFGGAEARGPAIDVVVGPGVETARTVWSDSLQANIFNILGFRERGVFQVRDADLVVNSVEGDQDVGASLKNIARAEAARIYSGFIDGYQGAVSVSARSGIEPAGRLGEVVFSLAINGVMTADLSLPQEAEPIDFLAFLDDNTRAIILRMAMAG